MGKRIRFRNREGVALAFLAVALVALLSMMALAIDLGMAFTARNEAQRVADAAALAGASAFLEIGVDYDSLARARAYDYALRNEIRNETVDSAEVDVTVLVDEEKVRVVVTRAGIATWFARFLDRDSVLVAARAAAQVFNGGTAKCLKPFALPDMWENFDDDNQIKDADDPIDPVWRWDGANDRYTPFSGLDGGPSETGYMSTFRNGRVDHEGRTYERDRGRPIDIKMPNPQQTGTPSIYFPWRIPVDPNMTEQCTYAPGGGSSGAATYRSNICNCNTSPIVLGEEYQIETGNMVGPTHQGIDALIDLDPDAHWDENGDSVAGSAYGAWRNSPRVIKVAVFSPDQLGSPGMQTVVFNNFADVFVESQPTQHDPVRTRFIGYASGTSTSSGGPTGSLVKVLRLVE